MSKKTVKENMAKDARFYGKGSNEDWTCRDAAPLLSRCQDGELDRRRREQMDLHLQQCDFCRMELHLMEHVAAEIKRIPEVDTTTRFTAQVMAKVNQSRIKQNRWFASPSVVYTFVFLFFLIVGFYATRNIDPMNSGRQFNLALSVPDLSDQSENQDIYLSQLVTETQSLRLMSVHDNALDMLENFNGGNGE